MKFKIGDVVKIVGDTFYKNAVGVISNINNDEYPYNVEFWAIDDETGESFLYEEFSYNENELELNE